MPSSTLLILCFLACVGWLCSHPAPALCRQYEPGMVYKYRYDTYVKLNEAPKETKKSTASREVGYKVTAGVHVTNVWENPQNSKEMLLRVELILPKLQVSSVHSTAGLAEHTSTLDTLPQPPIFVLWNAGQLNKVFRVQEDPTINNLKKGIASIFQLLHSPAFNVEELDVSGHCRVSYKVEGKTVKKTKFNCLHPKKDQFSHPNKIQSGTIQITSETFYELDPRHSIIKVARGHENLRMHVNIWTLANVIVMSRFKLVLEDQQPGKGMVVAADVSAAVAKLSKALRQELVEDTLVAQHEHQFCTKDCKSLPGLLKDYRLELKTEHLGKLKSASAFLRLLDRFRSASKKDILDILNNPKNKNIISQLLDIIAAAQTEPAFSAAMEVVDFTGQEMDIPERFLLSLSAASHPPSFMLLNLMKLSKKDFQSEKVHATVMLTIGSLVKTYSKDINANPEVIDEVIQFLRSNLASCEDDECRLTCLRSMRNAALPQLVPTLVQYLHVGGKVATSSATALSSIKAETMDKEAIKALEDVLYQLKQRQDPTARIVAGELLLKCRLSRASWVNLMNFFASQESPETSTFLLAKMNELKNKYGSVKALMQAISGDQRYWNYNTLCQKGGSASFTNLLSNSNDMNSTYGVNIELLPGGLLKTSSFNVQLQSQEAKLDMLTVGMFAGGLGSFAGGEQSEETSEDTTAGMELTVLDIRVRPYVFFVGSGELMGHVWSGTGSEPISAFQGNLLFMDHLQFAVLQNGLVVELNLRGVLSTDLSGSIQISLWNRNSHSSVKTRGAMMIHGSASVNTAFARSRAEFTMGGEAYIDFITDLDFYQSPFSMCIQMDQPPFTFRHYVRKSESVPGSQHLIRTLKRRTRYIPGKCYAMHRKNSEQCAAML